MTVASEVKTDSQSGHVADLLPLLEATAEAAKALCDRAIEAVAAKVSKDGKIENAALEREQHAAHGLAWVATYAEALKQLANYARHMADDGRFGETEALLSQISAAEYAAQLFGGVVMSQNETVRMHELGLTQEQHVAILTPQVQKLLKGKVRLHTDLSENTPGWKYNEWEMRGVPVRLEIGRRVGI